jgi:hypothetical protein
LEHFGLTPQGIRDAALDLIEQSAPSVSTKAM